MKPVKERRPWETPKERDLPPPRPQTGHSKPREQTEKPKPIEQ